MTYDMWLELAPVLIAVGGTLLGAIIGAFGAIMSARLRANRARREEQVFILADQVTALFPPHRSHGRGPIWHNRRYGSADNQKEFSRSNW
jgi:hypothetical protein